MTVKPVQNIFDLHCDTLSECHKHKTGLIDKRLHLSLDRLPESIRLCQAMAIFMPDRYRGEEAEDYFSQLVKVFEAQLQEHKNLISKVERISEIPALLEEKPFAMMLTVEGGSALAGKLENLDKLHEAGVRMMTLTWNAENEICGGADTDVGFSAFGRQVIPRMEELGIVVDVSHLNDRSFFECCELATRPIAASHSNARSICPHKRNLTDEMIRILVQQKGLVGLNYYDNFIVDGGGSRTFDDLFRHVYRFLELGGEDILALGSDYDGADVPMYLDGIDRLEYLLESLDKMGLSSQVVQKIVFDNAQSFFTRIEGGIS